LSRYDQYQSEYEGRTGTPLDLFNPDYRPERFEVLFAGNEATLTDSLGVYIQDQVTFAENFKLLLGGRFDIFEQTKTDRLSNTEQFQSGSAFSPRVGIVYQPIPPISLYASYSRSFTPTILTKNYLQRSLFMILLARMLLQTILLIQNFPFKQGNKTVAVLN